MNSLFPELAISLKALMNNGVKLQKCPQQSCLYPQLPGIVWSVSNMQRSQRTQRQRKGHTYGVQGQPGRVSTNGNSGGITPQLIAKGQPGTQLRGAQIPILRQHLPVQSAFLLHWRDSRGCSITWCFLLYLWTFFVLLFWLYCAKYDLFNDQVCLECSKLL